MTTTYYLNIVFAGVFASISGAKEPITLNTKVITPFIQEQCIRCHGPEKQKSKLRLDTLAPHMENSDQVRRWTDIYLALHDREMPPEDEEQPPASELVAVIAHLKGQIKSATARFGPGHQYLSGDIEIPAASANEAKVDAFGRNTILAAAKYLDDGALAWKRERKCLACHTTGTYMVERPGLSPYLGMPNEELLQAYRGKPAGPVTPRESGYPNGYKIIWSALGLAQVDKHINGTTSEITQRALQTMFMQQRADGKWNHYRGVREIPHITTDFELAVRAAWAAASAPGWLDSLEDTELRTRVKRLKTYLREYEPGNDYERALQLQLANFMPNLVPTDQREAAIAMLRRKQQEDGGWSTRSMSTIDRWANWDPRVDKRNLDMLHAESDEEKAASDPYMTGFAIVLLRESGVPVNDKHIQRGIEWLKINQRESGRWWMKSMYKDSYHFTTYMGTTQAMKALAICGELNID